MCIKPEDEVILFLDVLNAKNKILVILSEKTLIVVADGKLDLQGL